MGRTKSSTKTNAPSSSTPSSTAFLGPFLPTSHFPPEHTVTVGPGTVSVNVVSATIIVLVLVTTNVAVVVGMALGG